MTMFFMLSKTSPVQLQTHTIIRCIFTPLFRMLRSINEVMNINIQKHKRLYILFVSFLLLASVGVMPTLAAEYHSGTVYLFNEYLELPKNLLGEVQQFEDTVQINVRSTNQVYYDISLVVHPAHPDEWVLEYGGRIVYRWLSDTDRGFWTDFIFREIRFVTPPAGSALIAFLDDNGALVNTPGIDTPAVNPGDLVPDEIAGSYYQKLVSFINVLWTSPVLLSYIGILCSMLILSFIIFGSK